MARQRPVMHVEHRGLQYAFDQWQERGFPGAMAVREYVYKRPVSTPSPHKHFWAKLLHLRSDHEPIPPVPASLTAETEPGFRLTAKAFSDGVAVDGIWATEHLACAVPRELHDYMSVSMADILPASGVLTVEATVIRPMAPGHVFTNPKNQHVYFPGMEIQHPPVVGFNALDRLQAHFAEQGIRRLIGS